MQAHRDKTERNDSGNGRVYRIDFTATDRRGASCSGAVGGCVPIRSRNVCTDDGQNYNSGQ
jgi:chitinase